MTVDCQVMRFLVRSDEYTNLNSVVFVSSQKWSERVTGFYTRRQRGIESRLHVEERIRAGDV